MGYNEDQDTSASGFLDAAEDAYHTGKDIKKGIDKAKKKKEGGADQKAPSDKSAGMDSVGAKAGDAGIASSGESTPKEETGSGTESSAGKSPAGPPEGKTANDVGGKAQKGEAPEGQKAGTGKGAGQGGVPTGKSANDVAKTSDAATSAAKSAAEGTAKQAGQTAAKEVGKEVGKEVAKEAAKTATKAAASAAAAGATGGISLAVEGAFKVAKDATKGMNGHVLPLLLLLLAPFILVPVLIASIPSMVVSNITKGVTEWLEDRYDDSRAWMTKVRDKEKAEALSAIYGEKWGGELLRKTEETWDFSQTDVDANNFLYYERIIDYGIHEAFVEHIENDFILPGDKPDANMSDLMFALCSFALDPDASHYSSENQIAYFEDLDYPYAVKENGQRYTVGEYLELTDTDEGIIEFKNNDLNYAEIISVIGQSEEFSAFMISPSALYDLLVDTERTNWLFFELEVGGEDHTEMIWEVVSYTGEIITTTTSHEKALEAFEKDHEDFEAHLQELVEEEGLTYGERLKAKISDFLAPALEVFAGVAEKVNGWNAGLLKAIGAVGIKTGIISDDDGNPVTLSSIEAAYNTAYNSLLSVVFVTSETRMKTVTETVDVPTEVARKVTSKELKKAGFDEDDPDQEDAINDYIKEHSTEIVMVPTEVETEVPERYDLNHDLSDDVRNLVYDGEIRYVYEMELARYGLNELYGIVELSPYDTYYAFDDEEKTLDNTYCNIEMLDTNEAATRNYLSSPTTRGALDMGITTRSEAKYVEYSITNEILGGSLTYCDFYSDIQGTYVPTGNAVILDMANCYINQGDYPNVYRGTTAKVLRSSGRSNTVAHAGCIDCSYMMAAQYYKNRQYLVKEVAGTGRYYEGTSFTSTFLTEAGISITKHSWDMQGIIDSLTEGNPVCVQIKGYWKAKTIPNYVIHKSSNGHFFLIIGYNDTTQSFYLFDPGSRSNTFSFDESASGVQSIPWSEFSNVTIIDYRTFQNQDASWTPRYYWNSYTGIGNVPEE